MTDKPATPSTSAKTGREKIAAKKTAAAKKAAPAAKKAAAVTKKTAANTKKIAQPAAEVPLVEAVLAVEAAPGTGLLQDDQAAHSVDTATIIEPAESLEVHPTEASEHSALAPALPVAATSNADVPAGDMEENVPEEEIEEDDGLIQEPRFWQDDGWTAKVIKNEDDDGWAVAMTLDGEPEPALVGPWTMGRDKKNPKPLDANAFSVLVKTAYEVRRRHEQQLHAMLHKSLTIDSEAGRIKVTLQIIPDEYEPHAILSAFDEYGESMAEVKVEAHFKLNQASANRWIDNDYRRPDHG